MVAITNLEVRPEVGRSDRFAHVVFDKFGATVVAVQACSVAAVT